MQDRTRKKLKVLNATPIPPHTEDMQNKQVSVVYKASEDDTFSKADPQKFLITTPPFSKDCKVFVDFNLSLNELKIMPDSLNGIPFSVSIDMHDEIACKSQPSPNKPLTNL